jgi:hypothetical protein
MKRALLLSLVLLGACATMSYASLRPAPEVANCIAEGWRHAPRSGFVAPVSVANRADYIFVAVELPLPFNSPLLMGLSHPAQAVWAEVAPTAQGSRTRYHRAYQITHRIIDGVVVECQAPRQAPDTQGR